MASPNAFFLLILFLTFLLISAVKSNRDLLHVSCIHARYPDLCLHSLSTYAGSVKTPKDLAQAAVTVSLTRARNATNFLNRIVNLQKANKREKGALRDCVEQLSDSVDELGRTLAELRHLRSGEFRFQMSNAETWVSAALTNEDTCLDGFRVIDGNVKTTVRKKILNLARVTSNALYLINRLDSTKGRGVGDP